MFTTEGLLESQEGPESCPSAALLAFSISISRLGRFGGAMESFVIDMALFLSLFLFLAFSACITSCEVSVPIVNRCLRLSRQAL